MAFRIGQKVACVDDSKWPMRGTGVEKMPVSGQVYTIREFDLWDPFTGEIGIRLEEITNPVVPYFGMTPSEASYSCRRFRPVISKSTEAGMSMLRSLLKPEREKV